MSVYDNDTSKIYPTLGPSAPPSQEVNPQTYRLVDKSASLFGYHNYTKNNKHLQL